MRVFMRLCFSFCAAVFILSCFCYVYDYSGVHITNETGATDYKWEPGQLRATMAEGFAWFHMDRYGFNNASEKAVRNQDNLNILLMGSSHMEAASVGASENVGYLLNELLIDSTTYNIGTSGHTMIHCVRNMADAVKQYQPSDYVILETSNIYPAEGEMLQVINQEFARIPSYDSGVLYFMQTKIPAAKAFYKSVENWRDSSANAEVNISGSDSGRTTLFSPSYRDTLSRFLCIARSAASGSGAKLIIFYHQESGIDENGQIAITTNQEALGLFKEICEEQGIIFVDMMEPFNELYEKEHILAHGFVNSGVGIGHLNKYGHLVIAETLSELIKADMEGKGNVAQ